MVGLCGSTSSSLITYYVANFSKSCINHIVIFYGSKNTKKKKKKIEYSLYCVYLLFFYILISHIAIFYGQNFTYSSHLMIFGNMRDYVNFCFYL